MTIGAADRLEVSAIIDGLAGGGDARQALADPLMRLLRADHLASYVWAGADARYRHRVAVNMDAENLRRYEDYFQFHDPLTPRMAAHRRATNVDEVVDRRELERSEFYQDFLARDGLHHGINFFAYRGDEHVGDLRVWRAASSRPFGIEELVLLDLVGALLIAYAPAPARPLPPRLAEVLTPREREVARAVLDGLDDRQTCARLRVSYGTVRTHLGHIFEKWGVRSRMGMIAAVRREIGEFVDVDAASGGHAGAHDDEVGSHGR